jgi:glycosyltransferase involved in cell wall biosynthesis
MPDVLVFAALVPKAFGTKVILDLHDPMPELMMSIFGLSRENWRVRALKWLEKCSTRFADAVLTVNLACKKLFAPRSCAAEKVSVVMNSPDESIFKCQELAVGVSTERDPGKPFVIMYHGSLVERHGLDLAVRALGLVKGTVPRAEIRIYGRTTPFLEQVMHSVTNSDLRDSVHYLGPKDLEHIVEAIDECDVGIIPNRRSIFTEINTPTRIFEYLSRGKPVIAPDAPGIRDYFGDQQLIFFELGDANDLARKIEYAFLHPQEVGEIVRLGREVYINHRWSNERAGFVRVVGELLNGGSRRNFVSASPMTGVQTTSSELRPLVKDSDRSVS